MFRYVGQKETQKPLSMHQRSRH